MTDTAAEAQRIQSLHAAGLLDTPAEERFDRVARLAARVLEMPMALVSLVDTERQWFKACVGIDLRETPRSMSFCAHALHLDEALVVEDAHADARFADNPLVTGAPHIRFYAGHPVHAPDGRPLGTLCVLDSAPRSLQPRQLEILRDLAAVVELEIAAGDVSVALAEVQAQQRRTARLQEQFLRAAAHELRTPLTSVHGYADSLLDPMGDPLTEEQEMAVGAIMRNAVRLEDLVEDMLLVLRLESGEIALELAEVELGAVLRASAGALEARAHDAGVTLKVDPIPALVRADPRLVERVVSRLLASAVAATPSGGCVTAATAATGGEGVLSVRDGGPGLAPEDAARALEPFYRAAMPAAAGATGFALTIARGVATVHGGRVELRAGDGAGSEVVVTFPRPRHG